MYLLDFAQITKNKQEYRIATFFDPKSDRRKVITKFLGPEVEVPVSEMVTANDMEGIKQVKVNADINGNVESIEIEKE